LQGVGQTPGSWRVKHDRISPELARALYPKVLELTAKGIGPVGISRQLSAIYQVSLCPGTVRHWMVGDRNPQDGYRILFKQEPSPALSYVIGANIGDGCTLTDNWIVKLEVTDRDFAETFNDNMARVFNRPIPNKILVKRFKVQRLPMYVVRYSCKQLVKLLRQPLKKLLEIAFVYPSEFLRGFFDAEGYVGVGAESELQISAGVEHSSRRLLMEVKRILSSVFQIDSIINKKRKSGTLKVIRGIPFRMRKSSYSLAIYRTRDLQRFQSQVVFQFLERTRNLQMLC
jgi:intein-encoded DNA endonuclease-like protein